mgnify:CR=1 FL=1
MFCGKCGTENANGAKFCKSCGQALKIGGENDNQKDGASGKREVDYNDSVNLNVGRLIEKAKAIPKKFIIGGCLAIIALLVIICIVVNNGKTINLNDYLSIDVSRYDGYGNAEVHIDWLAIEDKYGEKIKLTTKAKEEYGGYFETLSVIEVLEDFVDIELDKYHSLSNGDIIKYTWEIDEELPEYMNCKLKYEDSTYTVSGLEEVETFDAFEGLEVTFSGIGPNGRADIIDYPYDTGLNYSLDKWNGLKNGDVVTVNATLGWYDEESYIEQYSRLPETMSKEYTVAGLEEYITSYEDIPTTLLEDMKKQAEDTIYSVVAKSYIRGSKLDNLEYAGYVFSYAKEDYDYWGNYNSISIIYKGNLSHSEGKYDTYEVYFPINYINLLKNDSNTYYEECSGILGRSTLGNGSYSTYGYTNPITGYMELIEDNEEACVIECGEGFEIFAKYELISDIASIDAEYMKTLEENARSQIDAYITNKYTKESHCNDVKLLGKYLLVGKEQGSDFEDNNSLYIVYSATVSNDKGRFDTATVCFPVLYRGLYKLPTGEWKCSGTEGIRGNSSLNGWTSTKGYLDGEEMFAELVTSYRDKYSYEVTEGLKEFGE